MAERRMFAKSIIDSDAFLTMPSSTQLLYFHLCMRGDDDGFVNSPRSIQRMMGASDDDFKLLLAKRFILPFDSGIIVIKHWRIHNYIQSDRYVETKYLDEKSLLGIKSNKSYTFLSDSDDCVPLSIGEGKKKPNNCVDTLCIQPVSTLDSQVSIGKDSIGEDRKEKVKEPKAKPKKAETLNDVLDCFDLDKNVRDALLDFIEMRKAKKRPLTPRALKMVINKLCELSKDSQTQMDIIDQTILHNWDTVYELKGDYQRNKVGANGVKLSEVEDHTLDGIL